MDQLRKNWTKLEKMDQIGENEWNREKMDQIGKNFKNGSNWKKWLKWIKLEEIVSNSNFPMQIFGAKIQIVKVASLAMLQNKTF